MDFNGITPYDQLTEKWSPLLDHDSMPRIEDNYRRKVTAALLENQEKALAEQAINETAPLNSLGADGLKGIGTSNPARPYAGYDPILISLVRRAMPNLMAYDMCGVQPMSAPTGLIFALKSQFKAGSGTNEGVSEALFQEAGNAGGTGGQTGAQSFDDIIGVTGESVRRALARAEAEDLGGDHTFNEMAFSIERTSVTAKTRALKAEYTTELAQDLRAVHGLDAETELANILSTEILAEINREIVRTVYSVAKLGAQQKDLTYTNAGASAALDLKQATTKGGVYDLTSDSDGRWSAERWRGLMFQIEREANVISKETRRGKGNMVICDADTASALAMGGFLNISPALNVNLEVDDTGNTFAGVLNGKFKVYIDPYATANNSTLSIPNNYALVGYKGTNPYDAGLFYCPYVPLQMVRAVGENTFQPKIGFKTRYGLVSNPFVTTTGVVNGTPDGETLTKRVNQYYRMFRILNLHGNA